MKTIRSEIQMRIELKFEGLDMKKPPQRDIEICLAAYLFLRPNANPNANFDREMSVWYKG